MFFKNPRINFSYISDGSKFGKRKIIQGCLFYDNDLGQKKQSLVIPPAMYIEFEVELGAGYCPKSMIRDVVRKSEIEVRFMNGWPLFLLLSQTEQEEAVSLIQEGLVQNYKGFSVSLKTKDPT